MRKKNTLKIVCLAASMINLFSCAQNDEKASITSWEVPDKYRAVLKENAGTVEEFIYTTHDYVDNSNSTEEKKANVYLPYGYDQTKQYDVLYLLHGTDPQSVNHIETWLYTIGIKNVLDNMIYYGDIDPLIVVTPTFYCYGLYGDDDMTNIKEVTPTKKKSSENFGYELRNDLIPAIEGHYSTYSSGTDESSFIASRDHRALAGLSNGARITLNGGMQQNFDYISYFGCFSSSVDAEELLTSLKQEKFKDYKLNYMFNSDGIYDFAYNSHMKMYKKLLEDEMFDEKNSEYVEIAFSYHSARSWRVGLYDALQRFFK